jgi:hypothetical protein
VAGLCEYDSRNGSTRISRSRTARCSWMESWYADTVQPCVDTFQVCAIGGSLVAGGVTKTKSLFKAAIVDAGATSREAMVAESGSPELKANP